MTNITSAVEVTQADKDAAVDCAYALGMDVEAFTSGACDTLVQAFARHRLAALGEAALAVRDCMVAQEWPPTDGDRQIDEVLDAIRALAKGGAS